MSHYFFLQYNIVQFNKQKLHNKGKQHINAQIKYNP